MAEPILVFVMVVTACMPGTASNAAATIASHSDLMPQSLLLCEERDAATRRRGRQASRVAPKRSNTAIAEMMASSVGGHSRSVVGTSVVGGTVNDRKRIIHSDPPAVETAVGKPGVAADIGATMRRQASSNVDIGADRDAASARPIEPPMPPVCFTAGNARSLLRPFQGLGNWSPPPESRLSRPSAKLTDNRIVGSKASTAVGECTDGSTAADGEPLMHSETIWAMQSAR